MLLQISLCASLLCRPSAYTYVHAGHRHVLTCICVVLEFLLYRVAIIACVLQCIIPILCCSVHLVLSYDNRPTGTAFVEFASPQDANTALSKDRQMLGNRYIELFRSGPEEVARSTGSY